MESAAKLIALAACVQAFITAFAMIRLSRARMALLKSGAVDRDKAALDKSVWPDEIKKLDNNLNNQFETPILFFAIAALSIATGLTDKFLAILAWVFIIGRIAHMIIHTSSNHLGQRGAAFGVGFGAVLLMWIWFAVRLIAG